MFYDGLFPEADSAWVPTLGDVLKKKSEGAYGFTDVGWDELEVPADCPTVSQRMDSLKVRFEERYFNRMLNSETLERWQVRLQNRFDEVVRRYERAYELYSRYEQDMMDDVLEGEERVITTKNTQGGSDTSKGKVRNIDTPDEAVNASDDYASSRQDTDNTVNYGRTDEGNSTERRTVTGASLVDNINNSIYDWRDLDTEFVKEFENCFMNVFWY